MPETIQDLMPETPDLNAERLVELKRILPDIFTDEGKIDEKQLHAILQNAGAEDKPQTSKETYEFNWFGKAKAKEEAYRPTRLTLEYDPTRSFNADNSDNVIIEGENLEVLKLLLCGYRGKIKCIYIDPPYNTGKDFVYSDKHAIDYREYLEKTGKMRDGIKTDANADTSGRYHSDWLSMMYSRLIVAQQLLEPNGAIFISIDENEITNLRKLCEIVFGATNFVAQLTLLCNPRGRSQDKYFATTHEYVLVFSNTIQPKGSFSLEKDEEQIEAEYQEEDENGKYRLLGLANSHRDFGKHNRPNLHYPIYVDVVTGEVELTAGTNGNTEKVLPNWNDGFEGCWTWDKKKFLKDKDFLVGKQDSNGRWKIWRKSYASGADRMCKTILLDKTFQTQKGQKRFNELFANKGKIFTSPKSVDLLKELLQTKLEDDSIVLDFFAGSGSTGEAIMEVIATGLTKPKYILVQLDEATKETSDAFKNGFKKISDITIQRNKLAAERLIGEVKATDANADTSKLGFKVFTLEKSYFPRTEWTPEPGTSEAEKIASLKAYIKEKEDQQKFDYDADKLLTEVLVKEGFMLTYKAVKRDDFEGNNVYDVTDGEKQAVVCVDTTLTDATVKQLRELIDKKVVVIERALDTTKKWNLHNALGERFKAF